MVPAGCQSNRVVVIAAFPAADLRRLHTLLCCYESPFATPSEGAERVEDLGDVERLGR